MRDDFVFGCFLVLTVFFKKVREVRNIYQNPAIASGVRVRVLLPKGVSVAPLSLKHKTFKSKAKGFSSFFARGQNNNNTPADADALFELDVGNALQTHDIALRLEVQPTVVKKQVPIQVQIHFESPTSGAKVCGSCGVLFCFINQKVGKKCVRVLSSVLNVSSDREQVEKSANVAVIALAAAQRAASLARELNEFVMAREELLSNIRLANRIKAKVSLKKRTKKKGFFMFLISGIG